MSDKQGAPTVPPLAGGGGNNGGNSGGTSQQTVSFQQVFANVISSANVQQFVLASQVPGLTQVLPSGTSTQPIGVTRIVNLSGATPRVSVVNVATAGSSGGTASSSSSPARQNKLVLTTSPKLVRTSISNMLQLSPAVTSSSQQQQQSQTLSSSVPFTSQLQQLQSPAKKKRMADGSERPTSTGQQQQSNEPPADAMGYRRKIIEHKLRKMRSIRDSYNDNLAEYYFLRNNGNLMDFQNWKKRPPTPQYQKFLKQQLLEQDSNEEELSAQATATTTATGVIQTTTTTTMPSATTLKQTPITTTLTTVVAAAASTTTQAAISSVNPLTSGNNISSKSSSSATATAINTSTATTSVTPMTSQSNAEVALSGGTPVAVSTTLPPAVAQLSQQGGTPIVIESSKAMTAKNSAPDKTQASNPVDKPATPPISSAQPIVKLVKLSPASIASSSCDTISNQEQIVEKAKQEAYVMQRIAELQREGLWSEKRLPKVQEPPRNKTHWDYLLEEMVWLSTDFAQERKWKKSAAKKCARMVQKYFQEKALQAQKAEKLEELRLKKIAGFIAKEIKTFWANVEKLVEFKQNTRLEEKRKKALDQHLNFIVDQTEKYSSWLTEGLNKTEGNQSTPASIHSSRISSPLTTERHSDDDFKPNQDSDDDEETIAKAEEEIKSNHKEEVELLKKESELPLEDLLKELPPNYLEERDKSLSPEPREVVEDENDGTEGKDVEFTVASDDTSDDEEDTIQEQEKLEKNVDHKQEIDDLNAENEMTIEELMAKYGAPSETPMEVEESDEDSENEEENESESENEEESEDETQDDSQTQSDDDTAVGLKSLLEDLSEENKSMNETTEKQNEMDSVAAIAESIQPKGNTLLTTSVVTKIPFLLKHSLREYQHIGLDWLVTMYERKLNGILADEMGLGKTIQTIALLAHLACEKGNWGPHLIIVPTSVMLNWEMECKKWCPGFKILTYYGTQKERKQKRTGWTKPNAFHICITSYKLVIQDHQSFRRKKWKYLILDEAQNIKNFKSQRWQLLLNFQTQRRLLLTGTPLQNNLMELWSLMHFLMPNVFQSHREFKEWFSNPVTGMIEGNSEYNENIIRRLHKVLRPFLLRRLKSEVEKQLPKKYEHVVVCRLSKRQRYLYDDFMSRAKTKETLASGNLLNVMNVLMQLRKVCNHPNLFEVRPTVSPFQMEGIDFHTASLAWSALDYNPFKHIDLSCLNLYLVDLELTLAAFVAHRIRKLKTPRKLIEEIDSYPEPPPRCPSGRIKINVRLSNQVSKTNTNSTQQNPQHIKVTQNFPAVLPTPRVGTSPLMKTSGATVPTAQGVTLKVAGGQQMQGFSVQLVPHQGGVKAIPVQTVAQNVQGTIATSSTSTNISTQKLNVSTENAKDGTQKYITYTVKPGEKVPSFARLVQTSTGNHLILTNPNQTSNALSFPVMTQSGQRLHVLSHKNIVGLSPVPVSVNKVIGNVVTSTGSITTRPVMRVSPITATTSQTSKQIQAIQPQIRVTKNVPKDTEKSKVKEVPKSEFYLPELEEARQKQRQAKLSTLANINERRCMACPLYGEDLFETLKIKKPANNCEWHSGWLHCSMSKQTARTRRQYFSRTEVLANTIKSIEQVVEDMKDIFDRFVIYVPAAKAPLPRFHVSHPAPSKLWQDQRLELELTQHLTSKVALFHPITRSMQTQFPDVRLIQYDCGKLQSLDLLLRQLKNGNHRVLIFTQMTRMLDVLEAFLNYHGYIYLRLDGATRVDQRQVLMERFNNDKRIFCFILSTRSGGVGVNLTGADTVVFYDSDWNPTMDAQAQDRCHRIGQTRDVHIYRLISERTVEENILKKANQKRMLGDIAIEGGNFTTAYFKSSTIQDLFNVDQTETDASARMAAVLEQNKTREKNLQKETTQPEDKTAIGALENALAAVEEDLDVQAAKTAKAEAVADLAEFDENIPVEDGDNDEAQVSKAELEVQNVVSQLTPVERYAMRFVEESDGMFSAAQLAAAERELEEQKKEWELGRLRAMREEEERQSRMTDDDDNPITFTREDAQNQVNNSSNSRRKVKGRRPSRSGMSRKQRVRESQRLSTRQSSRQASRRSNRNRNAEEEEESTATESSESDLDTVSISDSESRGEEVVEEVGSSSDEARKFSQSDVSDEDEKEDGNSENEEDEQSHESRNEKRPQSNLVVKMKKNHFDLNSPRTRSRGDVKINLWTLDVSPILPESKPRHRTKKTKDGLLDKTEESDAKTVSDSFDNSMRKTMDVSTNSSAEENSSIEDNVEIQDTNTETNESKSGIRTRRSSRFNIKFDKEKSANNSLDESMDENKSSNEEVKPIVQETQNIEVKENTVVTHNKPGRPRKQSQSLQPVTESSPVIYSTRSSNKLSVGRPSHDKKVLSLNINCKELKICDINDTSNKNEKSIDIENTAGAKSVVGIMKKENDTKKVIAEVLENVEKSDTSEKQNQSNTMEERSPSPILSLRRGKVIRSYGRVRTTEHKDKSPALIETPDFVEIKQEKISNSVDQDQSLFSPMDIEEFSPEREICENDIQSLKETSPLRSSPILSSGTRLTKVTRSAAARSIVTTEAKDKQVTCSESKNKTKEKSTEEVKSADMLKNTDDESTISVVAEASGRSSPKVATEDIQNEQQVKGKVTRSSTRLVSETKVKEKDNCSSEATTSEQLTVAVKEIKEETPIFVSKIDSEIKSGDNGEQPPVRIKITRSKDQTKVQISDGSQSETKITSSVSSLEQTKKSEKLPSLRSEETVSKDKITDSNNEKSPEQLMILEKQTKESIVETSQQRSAAKNDSPLEHKTSESVDPKLTKSVKPDSVPIVGVSTRRSRVNSNIEIPSESSSFSSDANANTKSTDPHYFGRSSSIDSSTSDVRNEKPQQVPNPLNRRFQQSLIAKPGAVAGLRRRPDTPMPVFYAVRPVTRSLSGNNGNSSDSESSSSSAGLCQKLGSRNSRTSVDNGFVVPPSPPIGVRRARSTTYIKMSDRLAMERKEIVLPQSRGLARDTGLTESLTINRVISKRRPDTPMPSAEHVSKISKTSMDPFLPSTKPLPPVPKFKQQLPPVPLTRRSLPVVQASADSEVIPKNLSESQQKQPALPLPLQPSLQQQPLPLPTQVQPPPPPPPPPPLAIPLDTEGIMDGSDSNGNSFDSDESMPPVTEKPQRTAKVVAILSLDTKSNSSKASHGSSTSHKAKAHNSENSVVNSGSRASRMSKGTTHQVNKTSSTEDSSNVNSIITEDVNNESESADTSNSSLRASRRLKRTRLQNNQSTISPKSSSSNKSSSVKDVTQNVELEDDEDEKILPKRSTRFSSSLPPPPPPTSVSDNEKSNNSAT